MVLKNLKLVLQGRQQQKNRLLFRFLGVMFASVLQAVDIYSMFEELIIGVQHRCGVDKD